MKSASRTIIQATLVACFWPAGCRTQVPRVDHYRYRSHLRRMKPACVLMAVLGLMATGCRHVPRPADVGRSSVAFVDPPARPPPESTGETAQPARRSQWWEATLQEPVPM